MLHTTTKGNISSHYEHQMENGFKAKKSRFQSQGSEWSQEDVGDYRCAVQGQNYRSPAVTFDVQEHRRVFPLVTGIIIILVVAALLAGLYCIRRRRQKASDPLTSSLQLSQQNAVEDLYIPPDPISMSSNDTYSTLANIYSSPTDDSNAPMDHQTRISSDTNDTFANDYYNPTDGTYMNMDLQAADMGSADDTYTALDPLSISPDYDTLTTVRNQQ
ncbi:uncharacterized protein LOC124378399 isoform X2 [Silurus meridionalis]|uniref:uncharacterized protein LOC124378399 isoform X2 n=1 Tax=Silurus meridionalis TaxID=175797 RepID=UPI001EEB445A|nr:uncharacterized protein LOC124378399 isoform X2 [Silurus meridionalis]